MIKVAIKKEKACSRHKPSKLLYLDLLEWAAKKIERGEKQKKCTQCGRWYFREEI
jgi:hypothetical protein